jgi:hypothetical protein
MGEHTLTISACMRRSLWVAWALAVPSFAHAQARKAGSVITPSHIVVIATQCTAEGLDIAAFAEALRVELIQEGVSRVDVAASDASIPFDSRLATLRVGSAPCDAGSGVLTFEIADSTLSKSTTTTLATTDVDIKVRPRVAALVVAERLRARWTQPSAVPAATTPNPPASKDLSPSHVATPGRDWTPGPTPETRQAPRQPPPALPLPRQRSNAVRSLRLAASLEWRLFAGPVSALLGPRVVFVSPGWDSVPLRVHVDIGVAFGTVHDSLGDVSLTSGSTGLGIAWDGRVGTARLELGPKVELGWATAKGSPISTNVSGSNANAVLATASVFASLWASLAGDWCGMAGVDVGGVLAGLDARADGRPVAELRGSMLGVRVGVGYAF